MCRLFGLLGEPGARAEPWLVGTDRSLLSQSNAFPAQRQGEGWGIAWYDTVPNLILRKGVGCASDEAERPRFLDAARESRGPVVIGHLRKASNPLHLAKEELVALPNSQPFVHGTTVFAHNGSIPLPTETRAFTGRYSGLIRGVNDSEVLFYLLLKHLDETRDPCRAYTETIADLARVWEAESRPTPQPYTGLNVVLSRGPRELWAFCHSAGQHGTGILDTDCPYYEMTYRTDARSVVVASERLETAHTDWKAIPDGTYLFAEDLGGRRSVKTGTLPIAPLAPAA